MKQPLEGILEQLQDRIYEALRTSQEFQKMYIVVQKRSSLESFLEQLIQERIGEGLFISVPIPKKIVKDVTGPVYEQVRFSVQVVENVATNHSGTSMIHIAERVAQLLHLRTFIFGNQHWDICCSESDPWTFSGDFYKNMMTLHFETRYSF